MRENWLKNVLYGMCMGAADIIPGISGGTIAFIMGFYQTLVGSIKSFDLQAFRLLFSLKFKDFFEAVSWQFLLALAIGAAISLISLASLVHFILGHELYRIYLYAIFFGLIAAAAILCGKQIPRWTVSHLLLFLFGAIMAYFFSGGIQLSTGMHLASGSWLDIWFIFCGMAAVCALMLPGISGSYVLNILGMYDLVLGALTDFIASIKILAFDTDAFLILFNLGMGVLIGALLFSHLISWLLHRYHGITIAILTGFMVGGMRSVWPFWSYEYVLHPFKPEKEPILKAIEPIIPSLDLMLILLTIICACVGFTAVFAIESMAKTIASPAKKKH